jgi:NADH:ubiquinone oxidoreductase subunit 6 (subunit J)
VKHGTQELADWLVALGVLAYAGATSLAVLWVVIGLSYWRNSGRGRWLLFCLSAAGFGVLAAGLTFIASEPVWVSRAVLSTVQRSVAIFAVGAGWVYSFLYLRAQLLRTRQLEKDP